MPTVIVKVGCKDLIYSRTRIVHIWMACKPLNTQQVARNEATHLSIIVFTHQGSLDIQLELISNFIKLIRQVVLFEVKAIANRGSTSAVLQSCFM